MVSPLTTSHPRLPMEAGVSVLAREASCEQGGAHEERGAPVLLWEQPSLLEVSCLVPGETHV